MGLSQCNKGYTGVMWACHSVIKGRRGLYGPVTV